MDAISSSSMAPSIQSLPKAPESESNLVINKFGDLVTKTDAGSEIREMMAQESSGQSATTVADNGLGGTFEAEA